MSLTVFVDSDAFVALSKKDDTGFTRANKILNNLKLQKARLCTSNYVFSETITVISKKVGRIAALSYIGILKSLQNPFTVRWIDERIENIAIEIFKQQTSKNVSFTDCTNMAVVKHDKIDAIFSFDEIYRKNGFKVLRARP